jgi:hypothetical protein
LYYILTFIRVCNYILGGSVDNALVAFTTSMKERGVFFCSVPDTTLGYSQTIERITETWRKVCTRLFLFVCKRVKQRDLDKFISSYSESGL